MQSSDISKRSLPKIDKLIEWGIVNPGDQIRAKNKEDTATLLSDGKVKINNTEEVTSLQQWLKALYGWPSVQTYVFAIDMKTGKSLSDLRAEYMESHLE